MNVDRLLAESLLNALTPAGDPFVSVFSLTDRPNEPLTEGAAFGPGKGPSVLSGGLYASPA